MNNKFLFAFLVIITTSLMGSSFAVGKIGLEHVSPLLLVGIRFTIAGSLMALFVKLFRRKHPKTASEWLHIFEYGAV